MAESYKILGQSAPSATTATDIYTVPSATQAIISSIVVTNRGVSATTFRISLRPNGATEAAQHYIAYDSPIAANDIVALTLGLTVDAADVVTVYALSGDVTFSLFGSEIS